MQNYNPPGGRYPLMKGLEVTKLLLEKERWTALAKDGPSDAFKKVAAGKIAEIDKALEELSTGGASPAARAQTKGGPKHLGSPHR